MCSKIVFYNISVINIENSLTIDDDMKIESNTKTWLNITSDATKITIKYLISLKYLLTI